MRRIFIHVLMMIAGAVVGASTLPYLWQLLKQKNFENNNLVNSLIGAIIFLILSFLLMGVLLSLLKKLDDAIAKINLHSVGISFVGAIIGLIVGALASIPFWLLNIPIISTLLPFLLMIFAIYIGYTLFTRRGAEILKFGGVGKKKVPKQGTDKLLDTSVLIDGRVVDIAKSGFIDGKIIVPNFVLLELQTISDSKDPLKRAKGRRGLDLVNDLKEVVPVEISTKDYSDIHEVDTKLLRYASEIGASLVTNDFNLNKVAEIQGVKVLNINDLANAVKPQVVVGDILEVHIIRKGTERHQGIGYLPDGTMIVVEDTDNQLDRTIQAEVTKSLQTSAGRMIFADLVK
jgi:uncharacterized protein YacL